MVNPLQTPDPPKALVLTLLLVGGFVVPLGAGPAWADSHGAMQNALGESPYFLHDAPQVEGRIGMTLMVPWTQPRLPGVADALENLGYDRVLLQIPEGRAIEPVLDTVESVSLCPFPSETLEPLASTACLPLEEACGTDSLLSYCNQAADAEAEHDLEIVLHPGMLEGFQGGLRLDLAFMGDPTGGSHTLSIAMDGDHWSAEPVNGQATYETVPVESVEVSSTTDPGLGAAALPNLMLTGDSREFHSEAFDDSGDPLGPVEGDWSVQGSCGEVYPTYGSNTTFTALAPSEEECRVVITVDGEAFRSAPITVLSTATDTCAGAGPGICDPEEADESVTVSLSATLPGNWTIQPPLLGAGFQVETEAGADPLEGYQEVYNGTWTLAFVPTGNAPVPDLNYTIQARIGGQTLEIHPPVVAGVGNLDTWLMSPATWVFNAHTGQSVACAPALPGVCDDAQPLGIQDARFFLDEA